MKIYLDVCCLNRPFDDQTQDRIHLETVALITIFKHIETQEWIWVSSGVVNYEISKTVDNERRSRLYSLARSATEFISVDQSIYEKAKEIKTLGIKTYDALHIACAKQGKADALLSTDDQVVKLDDQVFISDFSKMGSGLRYCHYLPYPV